MGVTSGRRKYRRLSSQVAFTPLSQTPSQGPSLLPAIRCSQQFMACVQGEHPQQSACRAGVRRPLALPGARPPLGIAPERTTGKGRRSMMHSLLWQDGSRIWSNEPIALPEHREFCKLVYYFPLLASSSKMRSDLCTYPCPWRYGSPAHPSRTSEPELPAA